MPFGRDPSLTDLLFTGLVERVVALVSRVQGTYEFEVQPLREYFAARFLHETAPYSPVGDEKRGTRPDRFDAISRNFYWLNVTRFYAGCYSKGELASLIDRLGDLIRDVDFKHLSHPRVLGATLLGDWVFTQHPKSVSEVIRIILDGLGLRFLLSSTSRRLSNSQPFTLPEACGRKELVERCVTMLRMNVPSDFSLDILDLLRANSSRDELIPLWKSEVLSVTGEVRTNWIIYGLHLGCTPFLNENELNEVLSDERFSSDRLDVLLRSRHFEYLEASSERRDFAIKAFLDREVTVPPGNRNVSLIEDFGCAIDASRYAVCFQHGSQAPLQVVLKRYMGGGGPEQETSQYLGVDWQGAAECLTIIEASIQALKIDSSKWASEIGPWDQFVSCVSGIYGETFSVRQLAVVASGIKSSTETCTDSPELFDSEKSLCRRARYARLRAGNPAWWIRQFKEISSSGEGMLCCQLYFTWASANCISQTLEYPNDFVAGLTEIEWIAFYRAVEQSLEATRRHSGDSRIEIIEGEMPLSKCSLRTISLLRMRANHISSSVLYDLCIDHLASADERILRGFQSNAIQCLKSHPENAGKHLEILAAAYEKGSLSPRYASHHYSSQDLLNEVPIDLAKRIVETADRYPSFLVAAAENRCRVEYAKHIRPVGVIAYEEEWFS
ncbi:MAG: hypothetical protein ABIS50_17500 [Luteolibacter sp.]|uniref:hypothetical protein n=1 Tax=Luteolibacter sp. TaxID=1962973 RepID=UPI0032653181